MKIRDIFRKIIYSDGVNPLPAKAFTIIFSLLVSM